MTVKEIFIHRVSKLMADGVAPQEIISQTIRQIQYSFSSSKSDITERQLNHYTSLLSSWRSLSDRAILKKFQTKIDSLIKSKQAHEETMAKRRENEINKVIREYIHCA